FFIPERKFLMDLFPWKEDKDNITSVDIFLESVRLLLLTLALMIAPIIYIIFIFYLLSFMP
ncbi:hypothetical protein, partial [Streptococcus suis]